MTTQTAELLRQGIAAAKSGLRSQARELLMQVVDLDDHNEAAWLWLSGVVDDPSDQLVCLENVLIINPDNLAAARGLQHLRQQHPHLDQPAAPSPESAKLGELSMDWAGAVGFEQVGPLEEEEAFWQQEMATPVPAAPLPPRLPCRRSGLTIRSSASIAAPSTLAGAICACCVASRRRAAKSKSRPRASHTH